MVVAHGTRRLRVAQRRQRFGLQAFVDRKFVFHLHAQRLLECLTVGVGGIRALLFTAQVGLEDARGTDRQEILVDDRVGAGQTGGDQGLGRQVADGGRIGAAGVGEGVAVDRKSVV